MDFHGKRPALPRVSAGSGLRGIATRLRFEPVRPRGWRGGVSSIPHFSAGAQAGLFAHHHTLTPANILPLVFCVDNASLLGLRLSPINPLQRPSYSKTCHRLVPPLQVNLNTNIFSFHGVGICQDLVVSLACPAKLDSRLGLTPYPASSLVSHLLALPEFITVTCFAAV